jgi:hypothetical protein
MELILDDNPLDGFSSIEFHGLGQGGGEIDAPLLAGLAANELNLGWESHGGPPCI